MTARLLIAALLLAGAAFSIDVSTLEPQGYVSDFAGVIGAAERQDLEQYCARVQKSTGAQMAFVTIRTLDGAPVEDIANSLFRRWGIGSKQNNEGLLLLLVVADRRSRLEVGYGLEPVITDGTAGELLRAMRPALRENKFAEALGTAAHELGDRIARSKNITIPEQNRPRSRVPEEQQEPAIPWGILVWVGILLFLFAGAGRRRRGFYGGGGGGFLPGLILGSMMNRSHYGGYSRGGFGGYDSGDSFGGFGGGDSGGGGASSDW
jgi:uncharacterized protein